MINVTYFLGVFLVSLRMLSFVEVVQIFFPKGTPKTVKIMFGVILGFMIITGIDYSYVNNINSNSMIIMYSIIEISTGVILGFITNICFACIRYAGNFMDLQVGFAMMTMFDPNSNSNATLIERMLYWFSLIVFIIVDGPNMLIRILVESFKVIHIGQFILNQQSAMHVINVFIKYFQLGIRIAIPIVLIIILTDLTMGLVAKTVPQLNVMILGMPVKIVLGLGVISLCLPVIFNIIGRAFDNIPSSIRELYKVLPMMFIFASDDKTEEATPHKLSEARKKGQVAKSKEINSAIILLTSTIILLTLGEYVANSLKKDMIEFFTSYLNMNLNSGNLQSIVVTIMWRFAVVFLPVVVPLMIMGVGANLLQTGYINSKETLKPQFSKINPINGFKKMFSMRTVMELLKDIAVILVIGYVGYGFLKSNFNKVLSMTSLRFPVIITSFLKLATSIFFRVSLVMLAIALIDFMYQKFQFKRDMRMSKQEIKEEFKQMEGDPQIKGKIKQKQREMAMGRMMQSVPDASVVITNPTHIAVALKYEDGKDSAPTLVAKGSDYIAIKIKEKAKEHEVPIIENKPLARLIFKEVELESEIPSEMYQAVAEILALVYKLKRRK
ncbi:fused FliR family export protein/FlhB family type III secretion system protein [Clostridium massiliodielmoense]|uniref:fused FliR family export protein/FlhB family type III secretion system protein n=1 Tax=Clostridium massiliodielmoense TaxID=1776385 RepID=UPI0002EA455D|nr:fused FliR family export protein/FlhB family type III secretion system protein [Clostridium massiliodielmoense]KEH96939.1 flagellar biosynthesis protein FlhB [Clostridium botulinum C/D str. BKT12695]NEZ48467.1 fused FliR family export protein/FlhB family type III secretion system protein [Clostridium botulinum]